MPNRVVHPPQASRREPVPECCVIVENLVSVACDTIHSRLTTLQDPTLFPGVEPVNALFEIFGAIHRASKLSNTSYLIQFDTADSATHLVKANGLHLGDRHVMVRRLFSANGPAAATAAASFDPFVDDTATRTGTGKTTAATGSINKTGDPHKARPLTQLHSQFQSQAPQQQQQQQRQPKHYPCQSPYQPATPQSLSRTSRLNAASQPFIPAMSGLTMNMSMMGMNQTAHRFTTFESFTPTKTPSKTPSKSPSPILITKMKQHPHPESLCAARSTNVSGASGGGGGVGVHPPPPPAAL